MTIDRYIKTKIAERGITQAILADRAGLKSQSNVAMMLKNKGVRFTNLVAMLDALNCEVVFRDKETGEEKTISV